MTNKDSRKNLKPEIESKPSTVEACDSEYLKNTSGSTETASVLNDEDNFIRALLENLDFLNLKEKKDQTESVQQQSGKVMQQLNNSPASFSPNHEILLGILGPCALKGHIVHFYNLSFQIQKHIKNIDELEDPHFIEAYHYLRANPSVEAVFVYPKKLKAYYRIGRQILIKSI